MSLDQRLREGLEGLDALESTPPPSVVETVVARGRRKRWVRRAATGAVALAAAISAVVAAPRTIDALSSDGESRPAVPGDRLGLITTVAGTGAPGLSGDGGPANAAEINYPIDLAFDGAGNLYILELGYGQLDYNVRVRRVDPTGRISTVAGLGAPGEAGQLVLGTTFGSTGLAVDAEGTVYLGGGDGPDIDNRVIRVDPSGDVTTVAGTGEPGFSGDGGPATKAKLANVWDVAVDGEGNVYIAGARRIRRVDTSGVITTIAGTGITGFSGDGGPAASAQTGRVTGVAVGPSGDVFFIDLGAHVPPTRPPTVGNGQIRRIDGTGVITTIAGMDEEGPCFSGDGGPATKAHFCGPEHLWVDLQRNVWVADSYNNRIRVIDADGIVTTVAGTGVRGYSGDGEPALQAQLDLPSGVAVGPDGAIYIADSENNRVRQVVL
jgi:hypothetical protein